VCNESGNTNENFVKVQNEKMEKNYLSIVDGVIKIGLDFR
jgi:hypothetical protein